MRRSSKFLGFLMLIGMVDCGDSAAQDGSTTDGGRCCPISQVPACCMEYGGSSPPSFCGVVCDGMPWPDYPGWERRIDENGCPYWWTPPDAPRGCGPGFPEPRVDADAPDTRFDAPADADARGGDPDGRSDGDTPDADPDASTDGDARDDSDGDRCCPISPGPQCCMAYGGSRLCATVCDGMPWPDYPGWERRIDENGCPYWWTPPDAPPGCSAIPPEPRVDADTPDPRSDAPADADAPSGDPDARSDG